VRRRPLLVVIALAAVAIAVVLVLTRSGNGRGALLVSGTVEATEAQLGFPAAGLMQEVIVREGDAVAAGDELARLDRVETLARSAQAAAQVEAARAALTELERGNRGEEVAQADAAHAAATERLADAQRDLDRAQALHKAGAISDEAVDKAQLALDVATSQAAQTEEQLKLMRTGARRERIDAARAQLAAAEAGRDAIDAALDRMTIRAPFAGVVTVRHREPGEIVSAGSPVLTVMNRDDRWVRVYVPETHVGAVRLGLPAAITSDSYRDRTYAGSVVYIASEAEFTPKTVQTSEERVKLVYAVKVRIANDGGYDLKPGMPVDVRLDLAL
jgi:HlyD family secretion protein